jgi:hypothetical protein
MDDKYKEELAHFACILAKIYGLMVLLWLLVYAFFPHAAMWWLNNWEN